MNRTYSVFAEHLTVKPSAVSFMEIKPVLGILFVGAEHDAVARDFGDDGCGGNDRYEFIAPDDGFVRYACRQMQTAIEQCMTIFLGREFAVCACRATLCRMINIDAVNHFG